jgi:hypothetical protein
MFWYVFDGPKNTINTKKVSLKKKKKQNCLVKKKNLKALLNIQKT